MKTLMKTILCVSLFFPALACAECLDPIFQSFTASDGTVLEFGEGFSPEPDHVLHITSGGETASIRYRWEPATCEAVLDTEPVIYLRIEGGLVDVSLYPRFVSAPLAY